MVHIQERALRPFEQHALAVLLGLIQHPPGRLHIGKDLRRDLQQLAEQSIRVDRFETQAGDLYESSNTASVLTEPAPDGDYAVQTKVSLDVPAEGCCFNFVQAGLVVRGTDDAFVKLAHASIWETRQTEWAIEVPSETVRSPRYGNSVVGAPGDDTWLRIVKRERAGEEHYTAYTSQDGRRWVRGGVWTHDLGPDAEIGLVSMGGSGFTAGFDHVRVWRLR